MRRRLHTHQKNTRIPTQQPSTAPAVGMFQPRPFGKPSSTADAHQQTDLKTSLMQAERYGHHLSQMHDTDVSPPQVMQPKMGRGRSMQSEPAAQLKSGQVQPSSGGRPLPETVQQKMEAAFRTDFSNVRVHEGAQAKSMGADAYAQGNQIHFQPGKYNPTSQSGQQLLGHELTHVVQQRTGKVNATTQASGLPVNNQPELEAQADKLGEAAARGENVSGRVGGTVSNSGGMVQCKVDAVQCAPGKGKRKKQPAAPAPANKAPTAPAPANKAPTAPAPANKAPTAPAPANKAPTAPAPANKAPTAPAPANKAPTAPAPANKAPTAPAPTQNAPTAPAPANQLPNLSGPVPSKPSHLKAQDPVTGGPATFHHNYPKSKIKQDAQAAQNNNSQQEVQNVLNFATPPSSANAGQTIQNPSRAQVTWPGHGGFYGPPPNQKAHDPGNTGVDANFTPRGSVTPNSTFALAHQEAGGIHRPLPPTRAQDLANLAPHRHDQPSPINPAAWRQTGQTNNQGNPMYEQVGRPSGFDQKSHAEQLTYALDMHKKRNRI